MDRRMWLGALGTLGGIVVVTLGAIAVDLSGTGAYTLSLWQPVTLHAGAGFGDGVRVLARAQALSGHTLDDRALARARDIVADRIDHGLRLAEPSIRTYRRGDDRFIAVTWAGSRTDVPAVQDLLQHTGRVTFIGIGGIPPQHPPVSKCGEPPHPLVKLRDLTGESIQGYPVLVQGDDIIVPDSVAVGTNTLGGAPVVDAALIGAAAMQFTKGVAAYHAPNVGIALDDKIYDVRPSAHILSVGNQFQISNTTGSVCVTSLTATTIGLVTTLEYGALPVSLHVASVQDIGPAVGLSNAVALGLAALITIVVAALAIAVRYRLTGMLAVAALLVDVLVTVAAVKLVALTLTLAGLAGLALALIIAADMQGAIARRAREEARAGRPAAVPGDDSLARAWPAVRDAAAVALTTCALLWWVGTTYAVGVLADFAAPLCIGVAVSTATALVVSPALSRLVMGQGAV